MDTFGKTLDQARDADLVDHFRQLPGSGRPHETAGAGKACDHGLGLGVRPQVPGFKWLGVSQVGIQGQ